MPYSQKKNPVKMMKSALHMYKAEKKQGMHRDSAMYMNSPMYAGHESPMNAGHESPMEAGHESPMENASKYGIQGVDELKYMPIVDDMHRKGDSPAMNYDTDKGSHSHPHSPMNRESAELKDMPIVDIEKGDAKGSPAKMKDKNSGKSHGKMNKKEAQNHKMVYHTAKPPEYDKKIYPKNINKMSNSPAKKEGGKTKHGYLGTTKRYNKHILDQQHHTDPDAPRNEQDPTSAKNKAIRKKYKSPATRQGYNARLDESLAKDGKESSMKQSLKDRRDESKGMEKSKGKGAYSSDPKMS